MRSVALDLGVKKIAYCEVSGDQVIDRATVSSLSSLEFVLGPEAEPARVAIEACREAWFVHAKLTEWGNEVLLVDTTRSRQMGIGHHGRKNDGIDAALMARKVESGGIPLAHLLSPHRQELRRQVSMRRTLVEARTQYVGTIRGIARELGCSLPSCEAQTFAANVRRAALKPHVRAAIEPLVALLEPLQLQLVAVEQQLEKLCAVEPVVGLLTTMPGVGTIVAASFVSVIDDARRFHRAHDVESYLGLVPSENTTGGKRRLGGISKQGNSYLRSLLVQAAWTIMRQPGRTDPLQRWALGVAARRKKPVAAIALARRVAGVLWAMWRDGTVYDPELLARSGVRGLRQAAQSTAFQAAALERAAKKVRKDRARPPRKTEVSRTQ